MLGCGQDLPPLSLEVWEWWVGATWDAPPPQEGPSELFRGGASLLADGAPVPQETLQPTTCLRAGPTGAWGAATARSRARSRP